MKDFERPLHTFLAERAECPDVGPADADGARPQGESFVNIRTAPEAAIDKHRDLRSGSIDHFGDRFDGAAPGFGGAPTVVGDDNAIDAVLARQPRVLARIQPL